MQSYTDFMNRINATIPSIYTVNQQDLHIGELKWTCRKTDHNGWLVCDGRALQKKMFMELFNVIGTNFGGDLENYFCLPDARSKVIGAIGSNDQYNHPMGNIIGSETHQLSSDELAAHFHTGITTSNGLHNHTGATGYGGDTETVSFGDGSVVSGSGVHNHYIDYGGDHAHGLVTDYTGSNVPFNIMQPTLFIGNVIIYAGRAYTHSDLNFELP